MVSLAQLPMKSVIMDVVVADITPTFVLLLSRSRVKKVGGTLHMDLTYATIPVFQGENRRLYRELQFAYIVTNDKNLQIIPWMLLTRIWVLICCILVMIMILLVYYRLKNKSQSNTLGNKKMNLGKCILMDHDVRRVLE